MKTLKTLFTLIGFSLLFVHKAGAQDRTARMEKDIDVFEKVVNELFREGNWAFKGSSQASGTYVPGYGVIINVPAGHSMMYNYSYNWTDDFQSDIHIALKGLGKNMMESEKQIKQSQKQMKGADKEMKEAQKEMKQAEKEMKEAGKKSEKKHSQVIIMSSDDFNNTPSPPAPPVPPVPPVPPHAPHVYMPGKHSYSYSYSDNETGSQPDSIRAKSQKYIIDKMRQALQNYGDLLSQLAPGEKILLVYDEHASGNQLVIVNGEKSVSGGSEKISAEVKKDDIDAWRSGKIDSKTFNERIKTETLEQKDQDFLDYKIFAGILETIFNHSEETSFRIRGNVRFTYLPGFGVIYNTRMKSPYQTPSYTEEGEDQPVAAGAENLAKAKVQYELLQKVLKNNILDYGRSLRTLSDDQFILFNIQLPEQKAFPSGLTIKVKKEILSKYEKAQISREQALEGIVITPNK